MLLDRITKRLLLALIFWHSVPCKLSRSPQQGYHRANANTRPGVRLKRTPGCAWLRNRRHPIAARVLSLRRWPVDMHREGARADGSRVAPVRRGTRTNGITSASAGRPVESLRFGNHRTRRSLAAVHHRRAFRHLPARAGGHGAPLRGAGRSAGLRERGAVVTNAFRVYADADRFADCDRAGNGNHIRRRQEGLWQACQRAEATATTATEAARASHGDALRDGDARADGDRNGNGYHIVRVNWPRVAGGASDQLLHALRRECRE